MRLINTTTFDMVEMVSDIPPFAILSHTWGSGEVSYQEYQALRANRLSMRNKKTTGYRKILKLCERALQDALEYAWIDTCCIDKTSSAELSEAINSMFKWYRESAVCYAYLADVEPLSTIPASDLEPESDGWSEQRRKQFSLSRWFLRGWTLQELIAPANIEFLAKDWSELGTKRSLISNLTGITGIRQSVLESSDNMSDVSAAERMSWAANRKTTREEDIAYSLFGLFGVNLPLLYGEGGLRAFIRLQTEILRTMDDYTLLTWSSTPHVSKESINGVASGALSIHPSNFARRNIAFNTFNSPSPQKLESAAGMSNIEGRFSDVSIYRKPFANIQSELRRRSKKLDQLSSPSDPLGPNQTDLKLTTRWPDIGTPRLTSRGLLVTLFVCQTHPEQMTELRNDSDMIVAWPFSQVSAHWGDERPRVTEFVGILLFISRTNLGIVHRADRFPAWAAASAGETVAAQRAEPGELVYIPPETLSRFVPVTMYLAATRNVEGPRHPPSSPWAIKSKALIKLSENISLSAAYPELKRRGDHWERTMQRTRVRDLHRTALYVQRRGIDITGGQAIQNNGGIVVVAELNLRDSDVYGICSVKEHDAMADHGEGATMSAEYLRGLSGGIETEELLPDRAILVSSDGGKWRLSVKRAFWNKMDFDPDLILSVSYETAVGEVHTSALPGPSSPYTLQNRGRRTLAGGKGPGEGD
ncbi:heterokaryon incompatibility protein-domain-containing protein [Cercophora newfieldiana]|uniref:Heterokaryon incompatibility protein-domain-containing protein n=1 Tax=Cercophora newfieldiana TaxID=92897 RepID=A0AA39Y6F7_9PEZI|nr:heterokaryon incompatibility protein-domain-containing protein [Cercophora newfieldiana]